TGFNGEVRLRSSSDADETDSSRTTGSGGTMVASRTGSGGAGRGVVSVATGGGGADGLAIGAFFLPHAVAASTTVSSMAVTQIPVGTLRRMNVLLILPSPPVSTP